jgi:hypothetical protein
VNSIQAAESLPDRCFCLLQKHDPEYPRRPRKPLFHACTAYGSLREHVTCEFYDRDENAHFSADFVQENFEIEESGKGSCQLCYKIRPVVPPPNDRDWRSPPASYPDVPQRDFRSWTVENPHSRQSNGG